MTSQAEQDTDYADLSARPLLLDLMQQIWDRGDPDGYVQHLISNQFPGTLPHQVLMQTAYGDEYVSMYSAAPPKPARSASTPTSRRLTPTGRRTRTCSTA